MSTLHDKLSAKKKAQGAAGASPTAAPLPPAASLADVLAPTLAAFSAKSPSPAASSLVEPNPKPPERHLTVLVDAWPVHGCQGQHVTAEAFTEDLRAEVAKEQKAVDWTAIEYFRGRSFLAAKMRARLADLSGHVVITIRSDSELYKAIGEVLTDLADERVIGVR